MWTVVFVTQNKVDIDAIRETFYEKDIPFKVKPADKQSEEQNCFEVLVPFAEVNDALNVIIDLGV